MKKRNYNLTFILVILSLFTIAFASAEIQTLSKSVKQGDTISLIQSCDNSTYSNITKVIYPNRTTNSINNDVVMTKDGNDYNYTYSLTSALGQYLVVGQCDENGVNKAWTYDFYVNPNGKESNTGTSIVNIGVLFFVFFISVTLMISGFFLIDKPIIRMVGFFLIGVGLVLLYMGSFMANIYLINSNDVLGGGGTVSGWFVFFARLIKYSPYIFTIITIWVVIKLLSTFRKEKDSSDGWDKNNY